MTDWKYERVRALVSAAEDAVQRTRWVFLILNLGCAVMITAQVNLYGTWVRHVRERAYSEKLISRPGIHHVQSRLEKALWDDLYNVSLPFLGIEYSADDLIILGTASMSVLAFWFVYAHRRENHCIADLARIASSEKPTEPGLASYIYYAIAHHFVFTTTTENDAAAEGAGPDKALRWFLRVLIHVPWLSSLTVVLVTALSLFVPGIELVLVADKDSAAFPQLGDFARFEAILRMALGLAFTSLTAHYCIQAQKYDRNTHERLVGMQQAAADASKTDRGGEEGA
ncbi:MAG TPA: hypothetical protein VGV38_04885 [Pyrinomonadaceae bacterium]|nr:hypothetical protein [Pyrinomonadaceae bacterium]